MKKQEETIWKDVSCNYREDGFWHVEARKEETTAIIAYIDELTGRVIYHDPRARHDKTAQTVIQKRLSTITPLWFKRTGGTVSVIMKTNNGNLIAEFEPKEMMGSREDVICLEFQIGDGEIIDLQAAKLRDDRIALYEWSDVYDENWQTRKILNMNDIKDAVADRR